MSFIHRDKPLVTEERSKIERSIIEKCLRGDSNAQFTLYSKYSKAMFNLAYRMVNKREDAEDMLQEAFTEAFRKLNSFRYDSTFGAWLKIIVINKCINHLRKNRLELFTDDLSHHAGQMVDDNREELTYNIDKVFNAIENLPDGYRIVLTHYLLEGYDHQEISEILQISESTSKTQYMRAKNRLRQQLSREELQWKN